MYIYLVILCVSPDKFDVCSLHTICKRDDQTIFIPGNIEYNAIRTHHTSTLKLRFDFITQTAYSLFLAPLRR